METSDEKQRAIQQAGAAARRNRQKRRSRDNAKTHHVINIAVQVYSHIYHVTLASYPHPLPQVGSILYATKEGSRVGRAGQDGRGRNMDEAYGQAGGIV